jgi:hypothetical protein
VLEPVGEVGGDRSAGVLVHGAGHGDPVGNSERLVAELLECGVGPDWW